VTNDGPYTSQSLANVNAGWYIYYGVTLFLSVIIYTMKKGTE